MADTGITTRGDALTVSEVSRLAGVSVRALHHYDEIGLLVPSARSDAGYRLYSRDDLDRLQEILLFRELEIPLDDIAVLLAGGAFDILLPADADLHFAKIRVFHGQILAHETQPAADLAIRVAGLAAAEGVINA